MTLANGVCLLPSAFCLPAPAHGLVCAALEPADYLLKLIPVLLVFVGVLSTVPVLVILERKICAWIQDRVGPNRVGLLGPDSPFEGLGINTGSKRVIGGWLQPIADV